MMSSPQTANQPPPRGFAEEEFVRRCNAVQTNMRKNGVDLLWLTTEADVRYLSGFLTQFWQSPTRPWHLLVPQSGKPVAVIPTIGEPCMRRTWVDDIRTWSSPQPLDEGVTLLTNTITDLVGSKPVIGVPTGAETHIRCPAADIDKIKRGLPDAQWCDGTQLIRSVRQIKSAAEILKLRHICQVTSSAFAQVPDIIRSGMTESDVFRQFRIACLSAGADESAYLVGAASAGGYEDIISPPGEHVLSNGDVLILDTGCVYDGYYSDFDRNFAVGVVDAATGQAHQRVWDATEAGLEAVKPGASCASLFATMQSVMQEQDSPASSVGRLGHGLGIQLTETPSIAPFDHTILQEGMVMTLEPGYSYAPGKVMVHEENLVVTSTGYELLSTRAPRDICVIK